MVGAADEVVGRHLAVLERTIQSGDRVDQVHGVDTAQMDGQAAATFVNHPGDRMT